MVNVHWFGKVGCEGFKYLGSSFGGPLMEGIPHNLNKETGNGLRPLCIEWCKKENSKCIVKVIGARAVSRRAPSGQNCLCIAGKGLRATTISIVIVDGRSLHCLIWHTCHRRGTTRSPYSHDETTIELRPVFCNVIWHDHRGAPGTKRIGLRSPACEDSND